MLPERSVIISFIICLLCPDFRAGLHGMRAWSDSELSCLCTRDGAAGIKLFDLGRVEPELLENLVIVLTEAGPATRRLLCNAVHLHGAADCEGQLAFCGLERNDDVVRAQLRVVDDFTGV